MIESQCQEDAVHACQAAVQYNSDENEGILTIYISHSKFQPIRNEFVIE
jgi:hypothetical protein